MPTLKQEFIYFNDAVGRTLPNAKMYFYEAGTTTPKNTFTSKSLANANQHPVVADAAGRFPVIWLGVGGYRVVVEDENGATIHDRDDINVADEQLNATSSIYFNTLADLKLLIAQNGQSVNPGIGDALRTAGETTTTDDLGAEWVVVAAGTGTADNDDTYVDLDNGLQAERVFNQLYRKNNLSEIATAGAGAQEAASGNIDALYAPNNLQEIEDAGAAAQTEARGNLGQSTTVDIADSAITTPKIADNAVTNPKVPDGALGSEKFQSGADERDWVLGRTATASVGAVGTYAMLRVITPVTASAGTQFTASNLTYSNAAGTSGSLVPLGSVWKLMGEIVNTDGESATSLFLRVS